MIKRISDFEINSEEELKKIQLIAKDEKYKDIFKYYNENIFYKDIDKKDVEEILNTQIHFEEVLPLYISLFDGGEYIKLGISEVTISECIDEVQENIEKYEDRIWNALDVDKEISQILKEQVKVVYEKQLESEREKINAITNGEISWQ